MFGVANIGYLVAGGVSLFLALIIFKAVSVQGRRQNHVVSLTTGYSAIFAILTLFSVGLVTLVTAFDLNPYLLGH